MKKRHLLFGFAAIAWILLHGTARAEVMRFTIDTQKSEIKATVADALARFRDNPNIDGTFQFISGEVSGDPADVSQTGHIKFVIDATTYNSGNDHRDRAVIGSAIQTAQFSTITFESTRIENVEVESPGVEGKITVVGNLTLHGTTRQMRVPVEVSLGTDGILTGQGEVTFDYTDFGMRAPRMLFAAPAGHEVTVSFRVIATRAGDSTSPQASN
jgi:polyisoprenoid-binding protein YceI